MGLLKLKPVVIASIWLGLGLPISFSTYYSYQKTSADLSKEVIEDRDRIADVLALAVRKAIWDYATEEARSLLLAYMSDDRVVRISVVDVHGKVLLEEIDDARRMGEVGLISRDVRYNDEVIGKVEMEFSLAKMAKNVSERAFSNFFIALLQLLACAAILSLVINRRILARLLRLAKEAELLAKKNLDQPFLWKDQDEIDQLGHSLEETRVALKQSFLAIEQKNQEMALVNERLEELVRERTATITLILDHVASGFLLVNRNLVIKNGYSKSCEILFATTDLDGKILTDVMGMEAREANHFQLSVDQVFEDILPENVTLGQIPDRIRTKDKAFSISGKAIKDPRGEIGAILFTITDATALERSEREASQNRAVIKILQNLSSFRDFVEESKAKLNDAKASAAQNNQTKVRMDLHTLKGNASVFGLSEMTRCIHRLEDEAKITSNDIAQVEQALQAFLEENLEVIKVSYTSKTIDTFEISREDLSNLEHRFRSAKEDQRMDAVVRWIDEVQKAPVSGYLVHLPGYVKGLAEQLHKKVELEIQGADIKVDVRRLKPVLQNIVHLVRNAIDHGIEEPGDRGDKPMTAKVSITFAEDVSGLKILVADDGAGIKRERLIKKALEQKLYSKEQLAKMDDVQISELIFVDGLSTAERLSEVSGRGIGMASVRESVVQLGGSIATHSVLGKGTTFTILIPHVVASEG